jgi:hypothetical protein
MKSRNLAEEHDMLMRVIMGDQETGEVGMKEKVDGIYDILVQVKGVGNFFGGIGTGLKWLLVIAAVVGVVKGWWVGILGYLFTK